VLAALAAERVERVEPAAQVVGLAMALAALAAEPAQGSLEVTVPVAMKVGAVAVLRADLQTSVLPPASNLLSLLTFGYG
jgi:hypothetical protein